MDDRIERQITINAPLDRVWDLVTEPGWWVPTDNPTPMDRQAGAITVRESSKWGRFPVAVVSMDPKTYAAFRWASQFPGEELVPGRTTLIEFHVTPIDAGVEVKVIESGFLAIDASAEVRIDGFNSNSAGWEEELSSLRARSETTG